MPSGGSDILPRAKHSLEEKGHDAHMVTVNMGGPLKEESVNTEKCVAVSGVAWYVMSDTE